LNPDGSVLDSATLQFGTSAFIGKSATATGTYTILFVPNNGAAGNVTLALTTNNTNPIITANTPVTRTIGATSTALLAWNFSGNAGENISPSESFASSFSFYGYILKPDGTIFASSPHSFNTYSFPTAGLPSTGTYTILFLPDNGASGTATITLGAPGEITISGQVNRGTAPAPGITVGLSGGQTSTASTDANGEYSFTVSPGQSYVVTPMAAGVSFCPSALSFTAPTTNQTANFASGVPSREYIRLGARVIAIANCGQ
jgi:hypothetical protein